MLRVEQVHWRPRLQSVHPKEPETQVTTNASCPFQESICLSQDANFIIDTGLLDVREDFGLNMPSDQILKYRRVLHCAPLVTDGYTTIYNFSSEISLYSILVWRKHWGLSQLDRRVFQRRPLLKFGNE